MTVKEFVDGCRHVGAANYIKKELRVKEYIPYTQKVTMCSLVIKHSSYKLDNEGKQTSEIQINTPMQNLFFIMYIIREYTNIEVDLRKATEEYDMLNEAHLISLIKGALPVDDFAEFENMLSDMRNDFIQNQMSLDGTVSRQVKRFVDLFSTAAKPILNELLDSVMKTLNEDAESKSAARKVVNFFTK